MTKTIVLSVFSFFVMTAAAFAAQPYQTKKSPKLLKAQSPTIIVKDYPIQLHSHIHPQETDLAMVSVEKKPEEKSATRKVQNRERKQSTSIASSVYVPTSKQLRKVKRLEKKLEKQEKKEEAANGSKSLIAALLLCFFVGIFGIHRFYMGYYGIGFLQLITLGFFGIWTLIDFILLLVGELQPKNGTFEQSLDDELDEIF